MGGGFGGKESQATQWAVLAALGAWKTGRPCKIRLDRDDDMIMTGKRHDFRVDYRVGFGKDGVLRAVDVTFSARCGYSEDLSLGVVDRTMFHADNAYFYPTVPHPDAADAHQHRVEHRLPRLRRPAGHALRRAHDGPHRLCHRARPARCAQGQLLRRRRPRPHALQHAGRGQHPPRDRQRPRADQRLLGRGGRRSPSSTPRARCSRRASR